LKDVNKLVDAEMKKKEKQYEEDVDIQRRVLEKKKNSNEREYESYLEELRQRRLEAQVKRFRKEKTREMWGSNLFSKKNNRFMFKDKCYLGRYY
jgi:predicted metal-dependent hydrolase